MIYDAVDYLSLHGIRPVEILIVGWCLIGGLASLILAKENKQPHRPRQRRPQ